MADRSNGGGGSAPYLALLVGALIVVVAVLGFAMYGGGSLPSTTRNVDVNVHVPKPSLPDMPSTPDPTPTPPPINKPSV